MPRDTRDQRDEWSCRVCTLLNNLREWKCIACDSERPEEDERECAPWICSMCTLVNEWHESKCSACEQDRHPPPSVAQAQLASLSTNLSTLAAQVELPATGTTLDKTEAQPTRQSRQRRPSLANSTSPTRPKLLTSLKQSAVKKQTLKKTATPEPGSVASGHKVADEEEDLPDAPKFDLLGFGTSTAATGSNNFQYSDSPLNMDTSGPSFFLLGVGSMEDAGSDGTPTKAIDRDIQVSRADSVPSGFDSGAGYFDSEVNRNEIQLVEAGLQLSDSESDEHSTKWLKRLHHSQPTTRPSKKDRVESPKAGDRGEWECRVCTNRNRNKLKNCDLCDTNRICIDSSKSSIVEETAMQVECQVCTHKNPEDSSQCLLCKSSIESISYPTGTAAVTKQPSISTFTCSVCTNVNPDYLDHCEICESRREMIKCPACTTINDSSLKRCEMCDTMLGVLASISGNINLGGLTADTSSIVPGLQSTRHTRFPIECIDLASSQERSAGGSSSDGEQQYGSERNDGEVGSLDDDFEELHPRVRTTPTRTATRATPRRSDFDSVEDISDNEMHHRRHQEHVQPMQSSRPELKEFQHFLSVDDVRQDFQCRIDYRVMFAESSRSRSYADRLQKRRRESQKRKRARSEPGQISGTATGKKKSSKKGSIRKEKAGKRRVSTGQTAAKSTRKVRRGRSQNPTKSRRSSAPALRTSSINHYDVTDVEIGDDVTTMAWEGIGSAGYL